MRILYVLLALSSLLPSSVANAGGENHDNIIEMGLFAVFDEERKPNDEFKLNRHPADYVRCIYIDAVRLVDSNGKVVHDTTPAVSRLMKSIYRAGYPFKMWMDLANKDRNQAVENFRAQCPQVILYDIAKDTWQPHQLPMGVKLELVSKSGGLSPSAREELIKLIEQNAVIH